VAQIDLATARRFSQALYLNGVFRKMTAIPKKSLIYLAVLVSLILSSCTLGSKFEIFNNTENEIKITLGQKKSFTSYNLNSGKSLVFDDSDFLEWDFLEFVEISIPDRNISWRYKPEYISHEFGEGFYFSHWLFKLQLESDGSIYVIEPGASFPQDAHVEQPENYPLKPNEISV